MSKLADPRVRAAIDKATSDDGGKQRMVMFDPSEEADLTGRKLRMPDGSWQAEVLERIGYSKVGAVYRVRLLRCEGRDVDFVMPIAGYCAGELYRQSRLLIEGLVPEWAA